jgi:transcriptional regulator with XRE-family HTH domain
MHAKGTAIDVRTSMESIKNIRTLLGLSQFEMAKKLSISRSMLAKAELKNGRLNSTALLKLAEFEKDLKEAHPGYTNADLTIDYCKKRLHNNNKALRNLEVKQERMQRCYVIGKDLPVIPFGSEHKRRVERRHRNCGTCAQQIGEIKISLLLSENKMLEQFIAALSPR